MWSNDPIVESALDKFNWEKNYIEGFEDKKMLVPSSDIFVFQELEKKSGNPRNQKAIYSSIESTMKSQDYEIYSLNKRKKEKALYNFNLISIIDAPLCKVSYPLNDNSFEEIDSDIYIGRYIINQKETESIINFIQSSKFPDRLKHYNNVHLRNKHFFSELENMYYSECLIDKKMTDVKINDFNRKLKYKLYEIVNKNTDDRIDYGDFKIVVNWSEKNKCPALSIDGLSEDNKHYSKIRIDRLITISNDSRASKTV